MKNDMEEYLIINIIKARPMTNLEYEEYMEKPTSDATEIKGYLVETDGSIKNHINHDGYITWISKKQFLEKCKKIKNSKISFEEGLSLLQKGCSLCLKKTITSPKEDIFLV